MTTVKTLEGTDYSIRFEDGRYVLYDGETIMKSPGGTPVTTGYEQLASAFIDDLAVNGCCMENSDSILCWHYELLDSIIDMNMKQVLMRIIASLMNSPEKDWTLKCPYDEQAALDEWHDVFGSEEEAEDRPQIVADWLNSCTRMQLTAAEEISRAFSSFNVAYVTAYAMEHSENVDAEIEKIAGAIVRYRPGYAMDSVLKKLNMFRMYYGFHMEDIRRTDPVEGESADEETAEEIIGELMNCGVVQSE